VVIDHVTQMMPAPGMPPRLGMIAPVAMPIQRRCGRRYHERGLASEADMELCDCGTGMIGRCANDRQPVCGDHSALRGGKRICGECVAAFDVEVARTRRAQEWADLRQEVDHLLGGLSGLVEVDDEATRALLLCFSFTVRHRATPDAWLRGASMHLDLDLTAHVRASFASSVDRVLTKRAGAGWDLSSASPQAWRLEPASLLRGWEDVGRLDKPIDRLKIAETRTGFFGGSKMATVDHAYGWRIAYGSDGTSGSYGTPGSPDVYVLNDGTIASVSHNSDRLVVGVDARNAARSVATPAQLLSMQQEGYLRVELPPNLIRQLTSFSGRGQSVGAS
jgi:hypothetical protein